MARFIQVNGAGAAGAAGSGSTPASLSISFLGGGGGVSTPYGASLTALGGVYPYTYSISVGSLPPGLGPINAGTGAITGTPTTAGSYTFTGKVVDSASTSATVSCTIVITGPAAVPFSVALTELGPRTIDLSNQQTHTTMQAVVQETISLGAALGTQLHVQFSSDNGATWGYDQFVASDRVHMDGTSTYWQTTVTVGGNPVLVLGTAVNWKARAWAINAFVDGGPSTATTSSVCSVTAVQPASATGLAITIHNAAGSNPAYGSGGVSNNIYMGTNSLGNPYAQVILTVTPPGAGDPNLWFYWAWLEWTDASGTPINPGGVANTFGWQNFAQFPNTGIAQQQNLLINYPAAGVDGYLKIEVWGMNRAYSATAAPFAGDSNAVLQTTLGTAGIYLLHVGPSPISPEAPASVTVSELGSSRLINLANQATSTTLQVVVSEAVTPATTFTLGTQLHVQFSSDSGTTWYDAGQVIYASDRGHIVGSNYTTTINIPGVPVWGFAQSFKARAWAKGPSYDGGPAGAVASSSYTLTAVAPAIATGLVATVHNAAGSNPAYGTGGTNNNIYMGTNSLGNPYAQIIVTVTPPGQTDPNLWFYWAWLEWTDASGTPINPGGVANTFGWQNFAQFPNTGVAQQQNLLINYPAVGVDGWLKLEIWGMNRAYSATAAPFAGDSNAVLQTTIGTSGVYLLHVGPPPGVTTPRVSFSAASGALVGAAFQGTTTVTSGVAPYAFAVTTGLSAFTAAGFAISSTTGAVTGTPTISGVTAITITVTDALGATGNVSCTIPVLNSLTPLALTLVFQGGAATVGSLYNATVQALSGTGPFAYTLTAGALPAGVNLGTSTTSIDPISGTPTASGTFTFTIKVTDSTSAIYSLACEIIVAAYGTFSASFSGSHAQVGIAYSGSVTGSGGRAPYSYAVTTGTLPLGLTLNVPSPGSISGTPLFVAGVAVTVTVTDANGSTTTVAFTITVGVAQSQAPNAQITGVTAGVSSYGINGDQSTTGLIQTTISWAANYGSQTVSVWLYFRRAYGLAPSWYWQGTYNVFTTGGTTVLTLPALVVPGSSVGAQIAVLPGTYSGDSVTSLLSPPGGAWTSAVFNFYLFPATATAITGATASAAVNFVDADGAQDWKIPAVNVPMPAAGSSGPSGAFIWYVSLTFQAVNSSGTAAPSGAGGTEVEVARFTNNPNAYTAICNAISSYGYQSRVNATFHYGRLKLYAVNRNASGWQDVTNSVQQSAPWTGFGTPNNDVNFGVAPAGLLDPTRNDPTLLDGSLGTSSLGVFGATSSGPEIFDNPQFDVVDSLGRPVGWFLDSGASLNTNPTYTYTAPNSIKLSSTSARVYPGIPGSPISGLIGTTPCKPGDQLVSSARLTSDGTASGLMGGHFYYYDKTGAFIAASAQWTIAAPSSGVWVQFISPIMTVPVTGTPIAAFLCVPAESFGSTGGNWYVDSCSCQLAANATNTSLGAGLHNDGSNNIAQALAPLGGLAFNGSNQTIANVGYTMSINSSNQVVLSNLPTVAGLPGLPNSLYPAGSVICDTVPGADPSTGLNTPAYTLFRNPTGSLWVASTTPVDMVAGAVATGVTLAANQITAGTLIAGVVYAGSIAASQITAGTLTAGVIYSGSVAASQILAGTITASLTINSPTINGGSLNITTASGIVTINNSTSGVAVASGAQISQLLPASVGCTFGSSFTVMNYLGFYVNGSQVLSTRVATTPTTLANVIAILQHHGLSN